MATMVDKPAGGPVKFKARSGGEFLKGLARGDKDILEEYRSAVETLETRDFATTADSVQRPAWLDKTLRLTDRKRPLSNLFRSEPLPADGNSYEYPYVKTETGTVQVQAAEGDDLAFLKIALDTDSATVRTVGGYTSLSRQTIERSSVAWLDTALRWLTIQYAEAFELYVRTFFEGLPTDNATARLNVNEIELTGKPATRPGGSALRSTRLPRSRTTPRGCSQTSSSSTAPPPRRSSRSRTPPAGPCSVSTATDRTRGAIFGSPVPTSSGRSPRCPS